MQLYRSSRAPKINSNFLVPVSRSLMYNKYMAHTSSVAGAAILDTWVSRAWTDGLQLESLPDFCEITVQTRNTLYEITVIDGPAREVTIRGGRFFADKT